MSERVKRIKEEMIQIYGEYCWLNGLWLPNNYNKLTYHHILEKRNGGKVTIENGALLGRNEHDYLNFLDNYYHKLYNDLNDLFRELNRTYAPPTQEHYEEINYVLRKVKK